jgi:hypothetical protein
MEPGKDGEARLPEERAAVLPELMELAWQQAVRAGAKG